MSFDLFMELMKPITALAGMLMVAWLINNWIRLQRFKSTRASAEIAATNVLRRENQEQRTEINRLEERVMVLERIVTDPARRTASAIELLD